MKRKIIALAAMASASGLTHAQTNVTMFGIMDAAVQYTKADGVAAGNGNKLALSVGGLVNSRWGIRGSEELGGGLKAHFWLESLLSNDDSTGFSFNNGRRSFVGLSGGFGNITLGRDYTPYFYNLNVYDVFATSGIGGRQNIGGVGAGLNMLPTTSVRANNSLHYFLPSGMPVFGHVMYAFGEQTSAANPNKNQGNAFGARVGAAFGPAEVAVSYGEESGAGTTKFTDANIGGKIGFGNMAIMGLFDTSKAKATGEKRDNATIGVSYGIGAGTIRASYGSSKQTGVAASTAKANLVALGYSYDLSKRTAVYGTVAILDNAAGQGAQRSIGARTVAAGGKTSGLEFGIRHTF